MQSTGKVARCLPILKGLNVNGLSLNIQPFQGWEAFFTPTVDCIYGYSHSILSGLSNDYKMRLYSFHVTMDKEFPSE